MFADNPRRAQLALVLWITFLAGLIALADSGHARRLFALAHSVPLGDKAGHFVLIGTLSFLVNLRLRAETVRFAGRQWFKASALVMSLVTLEECSQLFFRSRSFDLGDLAADAIGVWFFGWLAARYLQAKSPRLQPSAWRQGA